jgi:RNA-directed DNA polymerase
MSGDVHVRFCESRGVRFPPVTHPVVHCKSESEVRLILASLTERMTQVGLELHPGKTRIVYCKDSDRRGSSEFEKFTFLGYTFRPRLSKNKHGMHFVNFSPAVSDDARKAISREIRSWNITRRSDKSLSDLARMFNPIPQGWIMSTGASTSPGCIQFSDTSTTVSFVGP